MKYLIIALISLTLFTSSTKKKANQTIDLVLCLDLSSSTNGLLPIFKKHFWEIIYDFNRYYPQVNLKLGLIVYGRPSFDKKSNYVRVLSDLTDDYDLVFSKIMKFRTNVTQGEAWLDAAIYSSVTNISWGEKSIKHAYYIGNGPAFGISNDGKSIIKKTRAKQDVHFNFLFYNSYNNQKDKDSWKDLADFGKGIYKEFDFKPTSIQFQKKYDSDWITNLGLMISDSYLPYGPSGKYRMKLSQSIDSLSQIIDEDCFESRMIFKASRFYQNHNYSWDLIDLFTTQTVPVEEIQEGEVSNTIKSMKKNDLLKYLQLKKLDRKQLLGEMAKHSAKRDLFLYKKHAKLKVFNKQNYFYEALISSLEANLSEQFKITY